MQSLLIVFAAEHADFSFETTLSGRSYARLLSEMKAGGYRVFLFFLWLPSAEMAVARVANRVKHGGHNVLPADIRRRYTMGMQNVFGLYGPLLDAWWFYDATRLPPTLIASEKSKKRIVKQKHLCAQFELQAGKFHEEVY